MKNKTARAENGVAARHCQVIINGACARMCRLGWCFETPTTRLRCANARGLVIGRAVQCLVAAACSRAWRVEPQSTHHVVFPEPIHSRSRRRRNRRPRSRSLLLPLPAPSLRRRFAIRIFSVFLIFRYILSVILFLVFFVFGFSSLSDSSSSEFKSMYFNVDFFFSSLISFGFG